MKLTRAARVLVCTVALAGAAASAAAYDLPAVNLGFTTFLDGGPPAGRGLYFQQYVQYWNVHKLAGPDGSGPPPGTPDIDVWLSLSQFIYQSDKKVLGADVGLDLIIPALWIEVADNNPLGVTENSPGFGDLYVGTFLQWDPIMGKKGPLFMHRFEFAANLPTGRYSKTRSLNPGFNMFSIDPYWAGTVWLHPRLTASWRFHYLWVGENHDTNVKPGQALHANFAAAYEVLPHRLRVGVNGYWLEQVSNSEQAGVEVPASREQVFAIGPGLVYHFSQHDHLFFNVFFETEAENRSESNVFQLRWTHHFT
ncbi:MAG: phenol degradation protein meta [Candidatus Dadabacteria bacterium]|nr:MAG: phenol degradation protein meta [Candidatus Dadabacteria bacterium]